MPKTRYPLEAGNIAPRIVAWLVEGRTHEDIALELTTRRSKVTRQAVTAFAKRHKAEVEALGGEVVEAVKQLAITQRTWRDEEAQRQYDELRAIVKERGWMAVDRKWLGGEFGREVVVEKFDAALSAELRRLRRDVAEEHGDIPKPGININTGDTLNVNLINLGDYPPEQRARILELAARSAAR